jgi:hypothetical protein
MGDTIGISVVTNTGDIFGNSVVALFPARAPLSSSLLCPHSQRQKLHWDPSWKRFSVALTVTYSIALAVIATMTMQVRPAIGPPSPVKRHPPISFVLQR